MDRVHSRDPQNRQNSQEYRKGEEENDPLALALLPPLSPQSSSSEERPGRTWCPRASLALLELGLIADTAWGPEDSYQDQVRELWLAYHRQQSPNSYVEEARKLSWDMGWHGERRGDDGASVVVTLKEQQDLWNSILKVKGLWEGCRNEQVVLCHQLSPLLKAKVCTTCSGARPTPSGDSHQAKTECLTATPRGDAAVDQVQRPPTSQYQPNRSIFSVGDAADDESSGDLSSEQTMDRDDIASYDDSDYDTWTDNESVPDSEDSRQSSEVEQSTVKENTFTFPAGLSQGCGPWAQLSGYISSQQVLQDTIDKQTIRGDSSSTLTADAATPTPSGGSPQEKKLKASTARPTVCTAGPLLTTPSNTGTTQQVPEQRHHPYHSVPKQAKTSRPPTSSASYVQATTWPVPSLQRITYLPTLPSYTPASVMVFQRCPPPQMIPQGYVHHMATSPMSVLPQPGVSSFILPPIPVVRTQPPPAFLVPSNSSVTVMKATSRAHPSAWSIGNPLPPPPPPPALGGGLHHPHHQASKHLLPTAYGKYGSQRASFPSYPQGTAPTTGDPKATKHRQLKKNKREASQAGKLRRSPLSRRFSATCAKRRYVVFPEIAFQVSAGGAQDNRLRVSPRMKRKDSLLYCKLMQRSQERRVPPITCFSTLLTMATVDVFVLDETVRTYNLPHLHTSFSLQIARLRRRM